MTEESPIPTLTLHLVCRLAIYGNSPDLCTGPSESDIRKRLTLQEEKDELASAAIEADDVFTETKYLLYGLDLEEQQ